jgi:putative ABC transport system ATP-binding protein
MDGQPIIEVRGLRKSYSTGTSEIEILHGIDFRIMAGEFVAVMGPSGSGKSTMMNILGCLDIPSGGQFIINGQDTAHLDSDALADLRNRLIGFVFQGFNLLARTSLEENVALPLVYRGETRTTRLEAARQILDRVGLAQHTVKRPAQISGGQQQRAAIARALVGKPGIVFADEPTGNLDTKTSHEIMSLFNDLNRLDGITLVLVTHEADVARFAHRLIRLVDGEVEYDGPTDAYFAGRTP